MITDLEKAERLSSLMQSVGFAVWQLQELETTVAGYLVIRLHACPGIGQKRGEALIQRAQSRTLGSLLKELNKSGVVEDEIAAKLEGILEQRNWLIHRARRENRGVLTNELRLGELLQTFGNLAEQSIELQKALTVETESYVLSTGADKAMIDAEASRLANSWGMA